MNFLKKCIKVQIGKFGLSSIITGRYSPTARLPFKILTFHRVINPKEAGYNIEPGMFVLPENFQLLLKYIRNNKEVLPLSFLIEKIKNGQKIKKNSIILTFDDGWFDNYTYAFPILKHFNVNASIFLSTNFINTNEIFWSDKLYNILPTINSSNLEHLKSLLSKNDYSVIFKYFIKRNEQSLLNVINYYKYQPEINVASILKHLEAISESFFSSYTSSRTFLKWSEITEMNKSPIIDFGIHSHLHNNFELLSENQVKVDIEKSIKVFTENNLNHNNVFCFPGGYFNENTLKILKDFNFIASLLTNKSMKLSEDFPCFSRINIHDDIVNDIGLIKYLIG